MKTISLILVTVLGVTGCSLGKDSNQSTGLMRQNKEVNELYGPLVGTYKGKLMNTDHGDEDVQLLIWITSESVNNPDGTPGSKDVPKAYFRRDNPVIGDYLMDVKGFTAEVGDLTMSNLGSGPVRTIRAKYDGHTISGTVDGLRATLGQLRVDFFSRDTTSKDDERDRLFRQYQAIAGEYRGTLPGKRKGISITLSVAMAGDTARLDGFYRDLDVPGGEVDLPLVVAYRPEKNPPQITMNGRGGGKRALDFEGTVDNDLMEVDVNSPFFGGYQGHSSLHKLDSPPAPPPPKKKK